MPNPFAMQTIVDGPPKRSRAALVKSLKFLACVLVCFALVLAVGFFSRQWLLSRLTSDFDQLSSAQQQTRLAQIADFGAPAIEPLVRAMSHRDIDVARTAHELLRRSQNDWTVLASAEKHQRHQQLVESIEAIAIHLPDDRTGWATGLLQQTLLATVSRSDDVSRQLYRDANHAIDMLSLSQRPGPSILADSTRPQRVTVAAKPLPVGEALGEESWVDWPPTGQAAAPMAPATVYRSGADASRDHPGLQPVAPEQPVILRDLSAQPIVASTHRAPDPIETSYQVPSQTPSQTPGQIPGVESVTHLVDSPMQAYDDASVMHWLTSPHEKLREQARLELISRGYDQTELTLANRIAAADVPTRIELVDMIAREPSIDPRPWIWMMSRDPHRDVRMRVVSVMATMDEPDARRRLQELMSDESDPIVAARIRRVLDLR